jgi:hypothetical protein
MLVTVAGSVAAFYASAKGLQDGDAVPVIAVTGTAANVSGIVGGILVFGDPFPAHFIGIAVQCTAFLLVLVAAWLTPAPARAVGRGAAVATA